MKEKPISSNESAEGENSIYFTRHSKAGYESIRAVLRSDNPQQPLKPQEQAVPDLPPDGVELAQREAEKFFNRLNPQSDALFFVSSDQVRALETADIYRQVAHKRGFEVLKPKHTRSKLPNEIGGGEIRELRDLSLKFENVLINTVFQTEAVLQKTNINWDAVDEETKAKWIRAREIITSDDHGSWGANFFYHSDAIKEIFPLVETAKKLHEREFRHLTRLARFGINKARESGIGKNVKMLAFGHENYLGYALDKYFDDHAIGNCETIDFTIGDDGTISADFKGERKKFTE